MKTKLGRAATAVITFLWILITAPALAQGLMQFDLPPQPLADALRAVGTQTDTNILIDRRLVGTLKAPALKGRMTRDEAIAHLLAGTSLEAHKVDDRTIAVQTAGPPVSSNEPSSQNSRGEQGRPLSERLRLAQENQSTPAQSASLERSDSSSQDDRNQPVQLDEIIVTAQKREEQLIDVPASIAVLTGNQLESLQVTSLADMVGYIPGLNVESLGTPGQRQIVLRGLASSSSSTSSPTVATYIDDAPIGTTSGGGGFADYGVDLNPYDLDHVEVLEGPQGTLYGADAMGGVIKYVTRKPNLNKFEARAGTYIENVDSGGNGWGVRGAMNLPLITDSLALRLSGFRIDNAGWIDNIGTHSNHANSSKEDGGRASLLWRATDRFSIQLSWLGQQSTSGDQAAINLNEATGSPVYGHATKFAYFNNPFTLKTRLTAIDLNWDLGFANLVSSSSWSTVSFNGKYDDTADLGFLTPGYPDGLAEELFSGKNGKFAEEVRLASPSNQRLQWMIGGLYLRENYNLDISVPSFTPSYTALPPSDNLFLNPTYGRYREWAVFGNATYRINDRADVSGGVRHALNTESDCAGYTSAAFPDEPQTCEGRPYQGATTFMTNARFHVAQDEMFYVRVASGYRPGGGSPALANPALGEPGVYYPDKTINYEGGFKGQLFDQRLQINATVFYVDWTDIQIEVRSPEKGQYVGNAGDAVSKGVELSSAYSVSREFRMAATLDYTDAHLTQSAPLVGGKAGDQLPASSRWTGSVIADYTHPIDNQLSVSAGGDYRYRDKMYTALPSSASPVALGPQNIVGIYAGLSISQLSLRAYVKNLFNNQSYNGFSLFDDREGNPLVVPAQPRTVGLSLEYKY